jgi:hypothetical protein
VDGREAGGRNEFHAYMQSEADKAASKKVIEFPATKKRMSAIDINAMDADELVNYAMCRGFLAGDEESFEREWLRVKHARERRELREKHKIQKQGKQKT